MKKWTKNPNKTSKVRYLSDTDTLSTINPIITDDSSYCSDHSPPTLQFKLDLNTYIRLREKWIARVKNHQNILTWKPETIHAKQYQW